VNRTRVRTVGRVFQRREATNVCVIDSREKIAIVSIPLVRYFVNR